MSGLAVDVWSVRLQLREPYTIAYDTYDHAHNWFVRLSDAAGNPGLGCAAPAPEITGETPEACATALCAAAELLVGTRLPLDAGLRAQLTTALAAAPAAAAAVDMALHDLRARTLGIPLHALWGRARPALPTSVTLGIESVDVTLRRGRERTAAGFVALKVKGGRDLDEDVERLCRLREELGAAVELRFDANQGYDATTMIALARRCAAAGLALVEQPTPAGDPRGLAEVTTALAPTPVLADESFVGLRDAAALLTRGVASGLVVKLMKIGPLEAASAADTLAAAHGAGCMISCMDESAVAIAAALHWALCRPNVRWIDLDGHLDLIDDPGAAALRLRDGRLEPAAGAGLGLDLVPAS